MSTGPRCNCWVASAFAVAVILAAGVALSVMSPERSIDAYGTRGQDTTLGDPAYFMPPLVAPVAQGWALAAMAHLLTRTPIGPAIRRMLLLDNGITVLRDLAAQMPDVAPLHQPMRRLNKLARAQHEASAASSPPITAFHSLTEPTPVFVTPDPVVAGFWAESRVRQLHLELSRGGNVTGLLHERLELAHAAQQTHKMFSSWPPSAACLAEMEAAARQSQQRFDAQSPLSLWDGVPVAFKDMIKVKGYIMSDGSAAHDAAFDSPATEDDLLVTRFRELGAIILPPTTMTEGGVTPVGYSVAQGGPFNPYNTSHHSGGSSGGSAVAVALGVVPVAIGFDGGGSIRTPAALSGVVGLATGFGRVPLSSHTQSTMIKTGPLAATVADAALAYAVIAGKDARAPFYDIMYDGGVQGTPTPHLKALLTGMHAPDTADPGHRKPTDSKELHTLHGVTLGIFPEWFDDSTPGVREKCHAAVDQLVALGAVVKNVTIPNLGWMRLAHAIKISTEFAIGWDGIYHDPLRGRMLEGNTRITVGLGSSATALEVLAAEKLRAYAFEHVNELFAGGVDAIVTPTTGISAPVCSEESKLAGESNSPLSVELLKYVFLGNYLGLPGVSVPVGFDRHNNDMPVGLMFSGPHWSEDRLLKLASYFKPLPPPKFDAGFKADALPWEIPDRHRGGGGGGGGSGHHDEH